MEQNDFLYFDASATVPMLPEVVETIYKEMKNTWGNPSSQHILGRIAKDAMVESRNIVAEYLRCLPEEIIFTGSASEANNLALKGYIEANDGIIITNLAEHKSIIKTCEYLKHTYNTKVFYTKLESTGKINMEGLQYLLSLVNQQANVLVSIAMASSEIGTIQDINSIAKLVHAYGGILHVDATQCFTKIPIDITNIDMLTAGGSKIGAGKGIGILYKKQDIRITPLVHGGNQEQGLIAGTEDVPKMCGFATAMQTNNYKSMETIRKYFIQQLYGLQTDFIINGHFDDHLDNLISVSFKNKKADEIVMACSMLGLYISAGSACNSGNIEPSAALTAIGIPENYINGTIRISMPQGVTYSDVDKAIKILKFVLGE